MSPAAFNLVDPPGASPLSTAILWLGSAATGSAATIVAVLAVAAVGGMMLGGRIDLRRGVAVILGCFLIFGAPAVAGALRDGAGNSESGLWVPIAETQPLALPTGAPRPYDPYAGASIRY